VDRRACWLDTLDCFAAAETAEQKGEDPRERYRAAIALLDGLVKAAPDLALAYQRRGRAAMCLGRAEAARDNDCRMEFRRAAQDFTRGQELSFGACRRNGGTPMRIGLVVPPRCIRWGPPNRHRPIRSGGLCLMGIR